MHLDLTRAPLDPARCIAAVRHPSAGAIVTFLGVVRDHHEGRAVRFLEYEAHEPMARAQLFALAAEVAARWPLHGVACEHRLGRLEIGEAAVAVAISAAHRGDALDACRAFLARLKEDVPIWKKEFFADGAPRWVGLPEE